jgi:hypothetical protein
MPGKSLLSLFVYCVVFCWRVIVHRSVQEFDNGGALKRDGWSGRDPCYLYRSVSPSPS